MRRTTDALSSSNRQQGVKKYSNENETETNENNNDQNKTDEEDDSQEVRFFLIKNNQKFVKNDFI